MKLRDYMAAHRLRDHDVAAAVGVNRAQINRLRREEAAPSFALARRLYEFTNGAVTPNDFLDLPSAEGEAA